jgi:5-formyltetrahydrofolate cyclo-ligase
MEKNHVRQNILAKRKALDAREAVQRSTRVHTMLETLSQWREAGSVAMYCSFRNEVDTRPLIVDLHQRGVQVLLPRCRQGTSGMMDFFQVRSGRDLIPGFQGILEPDTQRCPCVAAPKPDLVLVPGVAFDELGFRLGYGGGYYDRFLSRFSLRARSVGLAFDFQVVGRLPSEPWDVPVRWVVTESRCLQGGVKP